MDRDGIKAQTRKNRKKSIYPSHLNRISLVIKGFITWKRTVFPCGTQRVIPIAQDGVTLPARVANHSTRFNLSCLHACHIIKDLIKFHNHTTRVMHIHFMYISTLPDDTALEFFDKNINLCRSG